MRRWQGEGCRVEGTVQAKAGTCVSVGVCLVRTEKCMHCGLVWWVHRGATVCARSVSMCSCACVGGCQCSHTDGVQRWFPPVLVTALLNPSRHSCVSPDTSEVIPVCPFPETFAGQACSFLIATIKDIRAFENRNGRDPDSLPQ